MSQRDVAVVVGRDESGTGSSEFVPRRRQRQRQRRRVTFRGKLLISAEYRPEHEGP